MSIFVDGGISLHTFFTFFFGRKQKRGCSNVEEIVIKETGVPRIVIENTIWLN